MGRIYEKLLPQKYGITSEKLKTTYRYARFDNVVFSTLSGRRQVGKSLYKEPIDKMDLEPKDEVRELEISMHNFKF